MADATGRCVVTFNGEIYNFQDIKAELKRPGPRLLHPLRHRGHPGRLAGMGSGLPGALRGHVRLRPVGRQGAHPVRRPGPLRQEALLLHPAERPVRLRLGAVRPGPGAGPDPERGPGHPGPLFGLRIRAHAPEHLPGGVQSCRRRTILLLRERPPGRHPLLGPARPGAHPGHTSPRNWPRNCGASVPGRAAPPGLGRAPGRVPLRRHRLLHRGRAHGPDGPRASRPSPSASRKPATTNRATPGWWPPSGTRTTTSASSAPRSAPTSCPRSSPASTSPWPTPPSPPCTCSRASPGSGSPWPWAATARTSSSPATSTTSASRPPSGTGTCPDSSARAWWTPCCRVLPASEGYVNLRLGAQVFLRGARAPEWLRVQTWLSALSPELQAGIWKSPDPGVLDPDALYAPHPGDLRGGPNERSPWPGSSTPTAASTCWTTSW